MSVFSTTNTIPEVMKELLLAPVKYPDILPTVLPLIVGMVVIELYFGKHSSEDLGWNTSVGNAVIWVTTGLVMLMTADLSQMERYATMSLIGLGAIIGYLDFYHKWSETLAFVASSSGVVYSLAYVFVVIVLSGLEFTPTVLKGGAAFVIAVNVGFKIIQMFETPARDNFGSI